MSAKDQRRITSRRLRFFNEFVYEALPAAYNAMDRLTFGAWWGLVRRALEYVPRGGYLLEIGFGPGRLHVELARRVEVCVGLDLAWGMCRYTQKRLKRAKLPPRLVQGNVFALPYANDTFTSLISTFAFSGFPNGEAALREMVRVTAVDGHIILVDIGLPSDGNLLGTSLARLWQLMGDFLYDLPTMMTEAGLTVITNEEYGPGKHIRVVVGQKCAPNFPSPAIQSRKPQSNLTNVSDLR